ncbi:MFS transporter, DHA1 family, bicyclomycin/chloramphenicol resistance protein [Pseudorhodobacter antarcticus]|jgi:DHA1 family bicyclomycin/chloramphenicol resistance-like MFS transporter|uniref:Bcr/CflA family efflux transporter n=1 Tax=Pseudorhodobacter antarcticus TaxID=1077947 RepID=A0A1H8I6R9_9RHOB|nr:multidrug effflux MFS transporter [Pseudorhodobacter antarcticus]SEN64011.1 MFS transporter, DHA1 family, bicyclomycin/chloramphenicol resistance protein [Pseudorhodobacter antarcticus]
MTTKPIVRYLDRTTAPHITTLVLIAGIAAMSLNVFLPSLPSMAAYFGVDYAVMQLSLSLYLGATALLQLFVGPISDRFGRRPVMLAAAAIFTFASLGTLIAPNYGVFLACRLIQAVIAAGFVLSRAAVRDMVPQDQAASMIGYVSMGMALVPMIAPMVGGALDEAFGWRASFFMLAVSGAALFWLIWADMGETAKTRATSFTAQFRQYPQLFASQRFWGYCLSAGFASGAFFAYLGGAPYVATTFYAMNAATLGFYFGAPALGYMAGNFISGRYSVRYGINRMIMAGALTSSLGMGLLTLLAMVDLAGPTAFFGLMIFVGIGNGLLTPSANAGMLSVRPELAGSAAGLGGSFMIAVGACLSALAGLLLGPTTGPMPLILLMLLSSLAAIACVFWVKRRERQVGAA